MTYLKSIYFILEKKHFINLIYLVFLMIISMILEAFGISLVFPLLTVLVSDTNSINMPFFSKIIDSLNYTNDDILFMIILFLPIYFFLKNLFLSYQLYSQSKFISVVHADTSQKIFKNYMSKKFEFFLKKNSSKLIQNCTVEINEFSSAVLSIIQLLTEIFIFIGLIALLLIYESKGAFLIIFFLIFSGSIFYLATKKRLVIWGKNRQYFEGERIKNLQQSFSLIREIKIYTKEFFFLKNYAVTNYKSANIAKWQSILNSLPRLWTELLAVFALTVLLVYFKFSNMPGEKMIPILGLFVSVAFRLIPSLNRFLSSIQNLKFQLPVVNLLRKELTKEIIDNESDDLTFNHSINFKNLSYKYNTNSNNYIFENINFSIKKGTLVGILGSSGSGKTTLINILLGLLEPSSGQLLIDKINLKYPNIRWSNKFGYVPQNVILLDDTIKNNIAFGIDEEDINEKRLIEASKKADIYNFVNTLPQKFNTVVGERGSLLSGGQIQRIGIARALYRNIEILILDESTSSLDELTEKNILSTVNELKNDLTIIMISHDSNVMNHCNKLFDLMKNKEINH